MNAQQLIQALVLFQQLSTQLPPLIGSIKAALSDSISETELQAELAKVRAANEASYDAAVAALSAIAAKK